MRKANARLRRGFSLLELLLVLTLVGLLTAVTGPMISRGMSGARLKTATKQTAAMLRYARNESVARKKPYWVVVDREENWIAVINRPIDTSEGEERYERKTIATTKGSQFFEYPEPVAAGVIIVGEEEVEEQGAFIFYPNGSSSGGTIQVGIDDNRFFTVSLDFITSMVSIQRGTEEET